MSQRHDPAYRLACRVRRGLEDLAAQAPDPLGRFADALGATSRGVDYALCQLGRARACGWRLAEAHVRQDLLAQLRRLQECCGAALAASVAGRPVTVPPVGEILAELRQLGREFPEVEFDLRGRRVVATTEPIVLEGVRLGRFAIELHVARLSRRPGADCFECVAREPNPASGNSSVTHPHVKDGALCAGDAAVPVAEALRSGRIGDAFCLINAVLHTYSPASPYVELEEWDGTACPDCGRAFPREQMYYCEACSREVCERCTGGCEACDDDCCRCCLEEDPTTGRLCCPSCREACPQCGREVDPDALDARTRLCPRCHARHREEEPDPAPDAAPDAEPYPQPENPDENPQSEVHDPRPPAAAC